MFKPWITIPVNDISMSLPKSIFDTEVRIMFKDESAVNNVIEQLEELKAVMHITEPEKQDISAVRPIDGNKLVRILERMERHLMDIRATDSAKVCRSLIKLILNLKSLEVNNVA